MSKGLAQSQPKAPLITTEDTEGAGPLEDMIRGIVRKEMAAVMTMLDQLQKRLPGTKLCLRREKALNISQT
jgi:hypothetical protein